MPINPIGLRLADGKDLPTYDWIATNPRRLPLWP